MDQRARGGGRERRGSSAMGDPQHRLEKRDTLRELEHQFREEERNGCYAEAGRYANKIASVHKGQGALKKALKWLEIDYRYTTKALDDGPRSKQLRRCSSSQQGAGGSAIDSDAGGLSAATYRDLAATLQCLGEVHLSLRNKSKAISYMHRHLELAKRMKNSAEEQRACTQLGRAYLEVFIRSEDQQRPGTTSESRQEKEEEEGEEGEGDEDEMDSGKALVEAKNYLEHALQIAKQMLTQNRGGGGPNRYQQRSGGRPHASQNGRAQAGLKGDEGFTGHAHRSSGVGAGGGGTLGAEALADAYLNVGVLFAETDDAEEALKCCSLALQVCDDEEIEPIAEVRSRIHHNLGKLYMKQKNKGRAKQHFTADIAICSRLGLLEEEGKGWTSLGDLHFREEEYEDALRAFTRAHELALQMEDESELLQTCTNNLKMVHMVQEEAATVDSLWNQHRKIQRMLQRSRSMEEKLQLLADNKKLLKELLETSESMQAYYTHAKAAVEYVSVAEGLGDTQSQSEAAEAMAISSYNLHRFDAALQWYQRSLDFCRTLKHTAGQIQAMIGLGNVLDAKRQWEAALDKYQQALRISRSEGERKYPLQELDALENIQYMVLLRFHNVAKSRETIVEVRSLKSFLDREQREEKRLKRQEADENADPDADAPAGAGSGEAEAGEEAEGGGAPAAERSPSAGVPGNGTQGRNRALHGASAKRDSEKRGGFRGRGLRRLRRGSVGEEREEERWEDEEDPEEEEEEEEEVLRGEPLLPILDSPEIGHRKGLRAVVKETDRAAAPTGVPSDDAAAAAQEEAEEDEEEWADGILLGQPPTETGDMGARDSQVPIEVEDSQPESQGQGTQMPRAAGGRPRAHWTATHTLTGAARGAAQAGGAPSGRNGEGGAAGARHAGDLRGRGENGMVGGEGAEATVEEVPDSEEEEGQGKGDAAMYTASGPGVGVRRPRMDLSWARQGRGGGGGGAGRGGLGGVVPPEAGRPGADVPGAPTSSRPPRPAPRTSASTWQASRPSVGVVSRSKVLLDSPDEEDEEAHIGTGGAVPCTPRDGQGQGPVQGQGQGQGQGQRQGQGQQPSRGAGVAAGVARTPVHAQGGIPESRGQGDSDASTLETGRGLAGAQGVEAGEERISAEGTKGLGSRSRSPVAGAGDEAAAGPGTGPGAGEGAGAGTDFGRKGKGPGEEYFAGNGMGFTDTQGTGRADRLATTGQQPRIWPCAAGPTTSGAPQGSLPGLQTPLPGPKAFSPSARDSEAARTPAPAPPPLPPFALLRILDDTLQVPLPSDAAAGASPTVQWLIGTCSHLYVSYHPEETEAPRIRRLLCNGITLAPQLPLAVALQVSSLAARAAAPGAGDWEGATPGVPLLVAVVEGTEPCGLAERYRLECAAAGMEANAEAEELLRTLQKSPKRAAKGLVGALRQGEGQGEGQWKGQEEGQAATSGGKGQGVEAPTARGLGAVPQEKAAQEGEEAFSGGSLFDIFLKS